MLVMRACSKTFMSSSLKVLVTKHVSNVNGTEGKARTIYYSYCFF